MIAFGYVMLRMDLHTSPWIDSVKIDSLDTAAILVPYKPADSLIKDTLDKLQGSREHLDTVSGAPPTFRGFEFNDHYLLPLTRPQRAESYIDSTGHLHYEVLYSDDEVKVFYPDTTYTYKRNGARLLKRSDLRNDSTLL